MLLTLTLPLSACAFDVVTVHQTSAWFAPLKVQADSFVLADDVTAKLGTGFPTHLRAGTRWTRIGSTDAGAVYRTDDQVVKVEASNIQEARIVVSNGQLIGFYLPVEHTFAPLKNPLPLPISPPRTQP
jgi:hypothetical protein